ncbi:MAG: hypothetical protein DMD38_04155 [Gemmatimonadetes bacterium]|nr:MAG: hypothetical protein AUI09_06135 [Gemmatimonadetes bacterium 13_2_20CM_2_66_5]OLC88630.1 MAG: hypothetical protein AUI86_03215 [Gemmatimonadetes bacterium 13_1_40CM_3_66_12]OLD88756.1 MAG: hypothetical protein AUG85_03740 [Gemmatimonadetes bacterium 13_1_20CM_4_66_11]PYP97678.1 MAG: hypothetical protein DMD38_04155 [Gemmatimonadota bacterium]
MRRRRLVFLVLFLLVLAAAVVFVAIQQVPPPVTEKPRPPAPPPRPLQADAEGYYEPGYQFSLSGLQFTRLTLHPETYVTFVRSGTRHEAGCVDPVIRTDRVQLRCDLERVGTVMIDGRFTTRYATTRLDIPVLSAFVTVRNPRGETMYRAQDAFTWHPPK